MKLERVESDTFYSTTSIYRARDGDDKTNIYVFSSKPTRYVINMPEIYGQRFKNLLSSGIERYLSSLSIEEKMRVEDEGSKNINVLTVLRGGFNFDVAGALYRAIGINGPSISFIKTQRYKDDNGEWRIREDYVDIYAKPHMTVFMGDIIATGSTLSHVMNRFIDEARKKGGSIKKLYVFTVGAEEAVDTMKEINENITEHFNDYEGSDLIFIEGIFGLAKEDHGPRIRIPGTDLLRHPATLTPEFMLSNYKDVSRILERCAIYDGGARGFEPEEHFNDLISYWESLLDLAESGFSMEDALKERWPMEMFEMDKKEFIERMKDGYVNNGSNKRISNAVSAMLESIYDVHKRMFTGKDLGPEPLKNICERRLEDIKSYSGYEYG